MHMHTRRGFLRRAGAAGLGVVLCRCGSLEAPLLAQGVAARARSPVLVGGRRVRTVDTHSHVFVQDVLPLIRDRAEADQTLAALAKGPMAIDSATLSARFQEMDRQRIDVHVISVHPGQMFYWADPELSARIVKLQNDRIAELCAAHPERFVGLGAVSLQHPALAADELDHAVKTLNLRGVIVGANVNGEELVNSRFDLFWKKAEELGALVFIHPAGFADSGRRLAGAGALTNNIGFPLDTTVALSHMIFEGFLDRFPRLTILAAHGGGFLASYIGRSDNCHAVQDPCRMMRRKPSEYLKGPQLFFDSLVYSPENLRHLVATTGASQVVLGTDFGFPIASRTPVETVLETPALTPDERIAILGGNAARLFKLPPE